MSAQLATISNSHSGTPAREVFLAFVRALAVRQARIDAMVASAANDNRPS
ncbi:hypothetical protein BHMPCIPO_06015 [Ensifer sesbaniae]|nr:hypothetical protein [Ensifer sesbaniae]